MEGIKEKIERLKAENEKLREKVKATALPPKITQSQINEAEEAIAKIEDRNVVIKAAKRYREMFKAAEKAKGEADKLTQSLKRIDSK